MNSARAGGLILVMSCLLRPAGCIGQRGTPSGPRVREAVMQHVRVHNFSVSLDGFGTGEGQRLDAPFGHAGTRLHEWFFPTRTFRAMQGLPGGSTGIDDAFASAWAQGIGAEIMGRGRSEERRVGKECRSRWS